MYDIKNDTTGSVFTAKPDESVLDAGLRQGHVLPYSCRDGVCGSCRVDLVAGEFEYVPGEPEALTDADRTGKKILLCKAHARSNLIIRAREAVRAAGFTIKTLPCRVHGLNLLADDVMQIYLNIPKTQEMDYLPGQYIDIIMRDGRHRSFSIANPPASTEPLELHVRKVDGGRFSNQVFEAMKVGDLLRLEGPLGTFYLREDSDADLIFVAGGTGFAPIKAIIEDGLSKNSFANRSVFLYWGCRSQNDLYMAQTAQALADQGAANGGQFSFIPVLSEPHGSDWTGATGFVHSQVLKDHAAMQDFEVYASGPPAMINAAREEFVVAGMREDFFYYDSFEYSVD